MALRATIHRLLVPPPSGPELVPAAAPVALREIFRRFWPYARPYRRWLWVGLLFTVLAPAIDTATIWMFKLVVDQVLVPRDLGPLGWIALAYLGLTLLAGAVAFLDQYLSAWVGERFLLSLRTSFFRHLHRLSLDFFSRRRLGDVLSRISGDIQAIESFVLSGVADALSYGLRIAFFVAALFYLSWELALVSLFVAPLFWLAAKHFSGLIKAASRERRRRGGSISAVAEESLANAALVHAYNRQEAEVERLHRENLGSFSATMAATRLRALFSPLIDLIELAGAIAVVGFGTWELSRGRLTLGGLLVFLTYLTQLYSPIRGFASLVNGFYAASASAERILELLNQRPAVAERPEAVPLRRPRGVLEFDDVSFRYPRAPGRALDGVSFRVEAGETLALVGPSGSGKSTIAKLLLRFFDPSSGAIRLDGHDLRDLRLDSLREHIAVVFQETLAFHGTVRDNIAFGRPDASEAEIAAAARAADADEFIAALPDGYDTVIGERGRRLSGGQLQRVAIARALIRNAPVLILDEPTAGLDAESANRVLAPLRAWTRDRTTIVISHDPSATRDATSVLLLDGGRVAEQRFGGEPSAVLAPSPTASPLPVVGGDGRLGAPPLPILAGAADVC
jgi:ATP-binding cassette subfamily B protein